MYIEIYIHSRGAGRGKLKKRNKRIRDTQTKALIPISWEFSVIDMFVTQPDLGRDALDGTLRACDRVAVTE